MFGGVRAQDLDLQSAGVGPLRYFNPGIAGELEGIHGISNYRVSQAEIVFSEGVGCAVTGIIERFCDTGVAQGLLDGIDTQIDGTDPLGKFTRDCSLPCPGEPGEDNQSRNGSSHF